MDPTTIALAIGAAREVIRTLVNAAAIANAKGEITDEQLAEIKARADLSDDRWDAEVAAARARLADGGE